MSKKITIIILMIILFCVNITEVQAEEISVENQNITAIQIEENKTESQNATAVQLEGDNAENQNITTYTLENPGMYVPIDSNMIEIVTSLENNSEILSEYENKEEYLETLKNSGIVLDAVDKLGEEAQKEILVVVSDNKVYLTMPDLNQFTEEDLNTYYSSFIESITEQSKQTQIEIKTNEINKTENGNVYFHITSEGNIGDIPTKLSTYYTIMNQKLVTIGIRYYNTEIDQNEKEFIEQVKFESLPRDNSYQEEANRITKMMLAIIIIIILVIMAIRSKDEKKIDETITNKEIKSYLKFGGTLSLLWILMLYQIYMGITDIINITSLNVLIAYKVILLVINIIALLLNLYIAIRILIRKPQSVKHIKIGLIVNGIITIISLIVGVILNWQIQGIEINLTNYWTEIRYLLYNISYIVIWILYMSFSQRVKIYYYLEKELNFYTFDRCFKNLKNKITKVYTEIKEKKKLKSKKTKK